MFNRAVYLPERGRIALWLTNGCQFWVPAEAILKIKPGLDPSFVGLHTNGTSLLWAEQGKSAVHVADVLRVAFGEPITEALLAEGKVERVPCGAACGG